MAARAGNGQFTNSDAAKEVPAEKFVSANYEQAQEADYSATKAEEIINDAQANSSFERRMARLEELFAEQSKLLTAALAKQGFRAGSDSEPEAPIVRAAPIPLDAVITVYIVEGMAESDKEPVMLAPNGQVRMVPRGCYTQITAAELEVLQNAVYEGESYPALNDQTLAPKSGSYHMTLSQPVKYKKPRFQFMVHQLPFERG